MDILSSLNRAILPGQRVLRVKGWEGLKKYPMPRDSEGIFLDEDESKDYIYMKKVDLNGAETCARYSFTEDPVDEFDPDKYAKKSDLEDMKEEILNGIDSKLAKLADRLTADSESEPASNGKRSARS